MMGPGGLDARSAIASAKAGYVPPETLLADARARIAAWEPSLGAVVNELDPPPKRAAHGPLAGAVVGVKDLIAVAGVVRGCGAPEFFDTTPQPAHAAVVSRILEAGGTIPATLALHALAYGVVTPQTRNPRAPDRIAGGSSGGSAAAVAAGLVHVAVGTDTGGSVRIPASCCGTVGLKPTRGLVPLTGVQPLAYTLDTVGPMAGSVADAALLLAVLAGFDEADCYSDPNAPSRRATVESVHPRELRIGVVEEVRRQRIDPDVRAVWEEVLDDLRRAGATILPVKVPLLAGAHVASGRVLAAEAAAVHGARLHVHPQSLPDDVQQRLDRGLGLDAARVADARHHGANLRRQLEAAFRGVHVLVLPTLPCRTPKVGQDPITVDGEVEPVTIAMTRLTNPFNLTGLPAGSVPAGSDAEGAPVGLQVVAPPFAEPLLLGAMAAIEHVRGGPSATVPSAGQ